MAKKIVLALQLVCLRSDWELSHVRDFHPARTADETWIPRFAAEGGNAFLTADANILKRPHQLVAVRDAGLISIILSSSWAREKKHIQAANLLFWWPKIEAALIEAAPRDCLRVPYAFDKTGQIEKKIIDFDAAARAIGR